MFKVNVALTKIPKTKGKQKDYPPSGYIAYK